MGLSPVRLTGRGTGRWSAMLSANTSVRVTWSVPHSPSLLYIFASLLPRLHSSLPLISQLSELLQPASYQLNPCQRESLRTQLQQQLTLHPGVHVNLYGVRERVHVCTTQHPSSMCTHIRRYFKQHCMIQIPVV